MSKVIPTPQYPIIQYHPRIFTRTIAHLNKFGFLDLDGRISINHGIVFIPDTRDVIPYDYGTFNIFLGCCMILNCLIDLDYQTNLIFNNDITRISFDEMRLKLFYEFMNESISYYSKDKTRIFDRSFTSKYNTYAFCLAPRFGYSKPTFEFHVNSFMGDFQKNLPYDLFVYGLYYEMFLNIHNLSTLGMFYHGNNIKCDVIPETNFEYRWNMIPFSDKDRRSFSQPKFPSKQDLYVLNNIDGVLDLDYVDYTNTLNTMSNFFWKDMVTMYRIGCNVDVFNTYKNLHDYTLRNYVRDYLIDFYKLPALSGFTKHRAPKSYKGKISLK